MTRAARRAEAYTPAARVRRTNRKPNARAHALTCRLRRSWQRPPTAPSLRAKGVVPPMEHETDVAAPTSSRPDEAAERRRRLQARRPRPRGGRQDAAGRTPGPPARRGGPRAGEDGRAEGRAQGRVERRVGLRHPRPPSRRARPRPAGAPCAEAGAAEERGDRGRAPEIDAPRIDAPKRDGAAPARRRPMAEPPRTAHPADRAAVAGPRPGSRRRTRRPHSPMPSDDDEATPVPGTRPWRPSATTPCPSRADPQDGDPHGPPARRRRGDDAGRRRRRRRARRPIRTTGPAESRAARQPGTRRPPARRSGHGPTRRPATEAGRPKTRERAPQGQADDRSRSRWPPAAPRGASAARAAARAAWDGDRRRRREPLVVPPRVTDKLMVITEHGDRDQIAVLEEGRPGPALRDPHGRHLDGGQRLPRAACRTCCPAWRRRSSTSAAAATACCTPARSTTARGPRGPGPAHRAGPEERPGRHGAGHEGPDGRQGRAAHGPDLAARPLPRVRAEPERCPASAAACPTRSASA